MQRLILRLVAFCVRIYYRTSRFGGTVPTEGPVLLVANHPNALVDPILLALAADRPVQILSKAPLFDMPVIGWLVRGMRALPVYRSRDGADTAQNQVTFGAVYEALGNGSAICIFPEGTSHSEPQLLRLKTGAARMALGAEATRDFGLGVQVLPVGLLYRAKRRFRSQAASWVGRPIEAREFADLYRKDEHAAVLALTERIDAGLREVTLNLDRWDDLPLIELAERIARSDAIERPERLRLFAEGLNVLRRRSPDRVNELSDRISAFRDRLDRLGLGPRELDLSYDVPGVLRFSVRTLAVLALGLPLAAAGSLVWLPPYLLVPHVPRLLQKDRAEHATVQILAGMLFFPAWWLLVTAGAWLWLGGSAGLLVLLALPPLGLIAHGFHDWRRETLDDIEAFLRLGLHRRLRDHLRHERDAIATEIEALRRLL